VIANVVRPKIDEAILFEGKPQNNPELCEFLLAAILLTQGFCDRA
jgi:hypothetical protein